MTDFEDYDNDSEQWICPVCQDPLCPGCESSVQVRLLKFALIPVLIVIFALILRELFFDVEEANSTVPTDTASSFITTTSSAENSLITATTVEATAISNPIVAGVLTEESIRSVVQVVQIDSLGPCSYGSGTVVGDGLTVLTNYHVIENASEIEILKLWQGLGYYSRARNLLKTAIIVSENFDGIIPKNQDDLIDHLIQSLLVIDQLLIQYLGNHIDQIPMMK